jgi:hypothetical protein
MPDDLVHRLTLRQADQARTDFAAISDDLDFIKMQLSHLPMGNEIWRATMLVKFGGLIAAVTLIEAFARTCL